jgi:hypothetical protein
MMEEDWTQDQRDFLAELEAVSSALAGWARDQFREGWRAGQVKDKLRRAAVATNILEG